MINGSIHQEKKTVQIFMYLIADLQNKWSKTWWTTVRNRSTIIAEDFSWIDAVDINSVRI